MTLKKENDQRSDMATTETNPTTTNWEAPQILWTEKIQTLAYQCQGGVDPVSGGSPLCSG